MFLTKWKTVTKDNITILICNCLICIYMATDIYKYYKSLFSYPMGWHRNKQYNSNPQCIVHIMYILIILSQSFSVFYVTT
jgi:hypothetical protein